MPLNREMRFCLQNPSSRFILSFFVFNTTWRFESAFYKIENFITAASYFCNICVLLNFITITAQKRSSSLYNSLYIVYNVICKSLIWWFDTINKNRVRQPILSYRVDDSVKGSFGAEDGIRTRNIQLGKLTLYR